MKNNRIDILEQNIKQCTLEILPALRVGRKISDQKCIELYDYLDELAVLLRGEKYIKRSLANILFLFYSTLLVEKHSFPTHIKEDELENRSRNIYTSIVSIFSDKLFH